MEGTQPTLSPQTDDRRDRRQNARLARRTSKDYAPPLVDPKSGSRRRAVIYGLGFLAALIALAALLIDDAATVEQPQTGMATATIDDILDSPTIYEGRQLTVVGYAEGDAADGALVLEDDDVIARDALLVVVDGELPEAGTTGEQWRATGTLEVFDGQTLSGNASVVGADLEPGDPVLIAQSVDPIPPPTVGW